MKPTLRFLNFVKTAGEEGGWITYTITGFANVNPTRFIKTLQKFHLFLFWIHLITPDSKHRPNVEGT